MLCSELRKSKSYPCLFAGELQISNQSIEEEIREQTPLGVR
jgi:hypothetical protein